VAREQGFFVERREAERCPAWKQPIPYCVVTFEQELLLLERLASQGEARLHGKQSIGIGGHVDPPDAEGEGELFANACRRELHEELELRGDFEIQPLGLLNDDATEVGAVHVGLVFGIRCSERPQIRETDKMRGRWVPLAGSQDLCKTPALLESWSRILLEDAWREGRVETSWLSSL
jgi:predicted NUDIX family phosphoesterase